jgi:HK97 family phage portal protein
MGIFTDSLLERRDSGTSLLSAPLGWLYEAFGVVPTESGMAVSERGSLKCIGVYACINALAQTIAQVPWDVFRRDGKKKVVARDRTEHYLLHNEPNACMTSYSFRVAMMVNVLLYGNLYVEIVRDGANRIKFFRLLPSWTVEVYESIDGDRLVYAVTRRNGTRDTLDCSDVIHVPCISFDGIAGLSPIAQHRQAVGLSLAAESATASFFGNGSRPSGYLSSASKLTKDQREALEDKWYTKFSGARNQGKVPILSGDLKWNALSIPPKDAQYIETSVHSLAEIARMYRMPGVLVGLAETATHASADAFFLSFVKFTITPWVIAIEQEFDRKCFPNTTDIYNKFDLNGLQRGDAKGRSEFYKSLWSTGSLSPNDIRDWEELDPVDGGDRYFIQQGFMPLDKVDEVLIAQIKAGKAAPVPGGNGKDPAADSSASRAMVRSAHLAWLQDVQARVAKWEKRDAARVAEAFAPIFTSFSLLLLDKDKLPSFTPGEFCTRMISQLATTQPNFAERAIARFEEECQCPA